MKFSLGNGKVVNIPAAFFFDMSDLEFEDELQNLLALDLGIETNDVWNDSVLVDGEINKKKMAEPSDEDEILPFFFDDDLRDYFTED